MSIVTALALSSKLAVQLTLVGGEWLVNVTLGDFTCSGILRPNPIYMQTRSISPRLLVTPLYYLLDVVCEGLHATPQVSNVVVEAPEGYGVCALGVCTRGNRLKVSVEPRFFTRHLVYDAIVAFDLSAYTVSRLGNLWVVYPRNTANDTVELVARGVSAVREGLEDMLGVSPREPRVIVLAARGERDLVMPGMGHTIGSTIYVKLPGNPLDAVRVAVHEAGHGWINYGLLYGDFSFMEGAVELLTMLALRLKEPGLFEKLSPLIREEIDASDYAAWYRIHAALWYAGIKACNTDIYVKTLRAMFRESLGESGGRYTTIFEVIRRMVEEAPPNCKSLLSRLLGPTLLAAANKSPTWPFIDTTVVDTNVNETERPHEHSESCETKIVTLVKHVMRTLTTTTTVTMTNVYTVYTVSTLEPPPRNARGVNTVAREYMLLVLLAAIATLFVNTLRKSSLTRR